MGVTLLFYFRELVKRYYQKSRIYKYRVFSDINSMEGTPITHQPVLFSGNGRIVLGKRVEFGVNHAPFFYNGYSYVEARFSTGEVVIGNNVRFNNNCTIVSAVAGIYIGNDCLVGTNFTIYDSDFHGLKPCERNGKYAKSGKVYIGNNVFFGSNVTILKGVSIGDNSVIAAGSVVVSSIPANVIAGGNPCKVLGNLCDIGS